MSETTTTNQTSITNVIANPQNHWRFTGIIVGVLAVIGLWLTYTNDPGRLGFMTFESTQVFVYVVLAAVALMFGFTTAMGEFGKPFAIVFGVVYVALGIIGLVAGDVIGIGLMPAENVIHLLLGICALTTGFKGY